MVSKAALKSRKKQELLSYHAQTSGECSQLQQTKQSQWNDATCWWIEDDWNLVMRLCKIEHGREKGVPGAWKCCLGQRWPEVRGDEVGLIQAWFLE